MPQLKLNICVRWVQDVHPITHAQSLQRPKAYETERERERGKLFCGKQHTIQDRQRQRECSLTVGSCYFAAAANEQKVKRKCVYYMPSTKKKAIGSKCLLDWFCLCLMVLYCCLADWLWLVVPEEGDLLHHHSITCVVSCLEHARSLNTGCSFSPRTHPESCLSHIEYQ